jgi:hypothetical protein
MHVLFFFVSTGCSAYHAGTMQQLLFCFQQQHRYTSHLFDTNTKNGRITTMTVADEGDNDAIESEEAILVFPAGGQDESCCVRTALR